MDVDKISTSEGQIMESNKVTSDRSSSRCNEDGFDDDGEDLPDNFFDDFSNQDFMEGLNVVDDWNDDDEPNEFVDEVKNKEEPYRKVPASHRRERKPDRGRRDNRGEPIHRRREEDRRRSRSRNRHRQGSYNSPRSEERERADLGSHRRDLEKTKRDIQRDKIRCAKDHKARVFQEQLKIAETGLVPPGTELDIVLNSDKFKHEEPSSKSATPIVKETKSEHTKEKSMEKKKEGSVRQKHASRSPVNKPRRRRPYGRSVSRERSHSPRRRKRTPHSRDRDQRFKDDPEIDLRYRIREKRFGGYSQRSPLPARRPSRSPSPYMKSPASGISERESWLRHRERYGSRHSKSMSPVNKSRIRESSPKRKKFSFMEEIEIKLRQNQPIRDPNMFNIAPNLPQLMTVPVPKPEYFPPYQQNPQMYMGPHMAAPNMCPPPEQYQQPLMLGGDPNMMPQMFIPNAQMFSHGMPQFSVPQPVPAPPVFIDHMQNPPMQNFEGTGTVPKQENNDLAKLFEDKKISLSDFLSVSAKPLDSTAPIDIHNKIKVISRCQEAIKLLEDPKLLGRFIPRISQQVMDSEKRAAENTKSACQSPLRKAVVIRFNFTVPLSKRWTNCKTLDQQSSRTTLHKLTVLLGITDHDLLSPVPEETPVQREGTPIPESVPIVPQPPIITLPKQYLTKLCQTDPVICQICEIRNARKLSDGQTQTIEKSSCDVSTQVSIEDLTKSCTTFIPRGILKSNSSPVKSISHLTPAQLLAQLDAEKREDSNLSGAKKDTFPAYGRSYADTPKANPSANPFGDSFMGGDGANSGIYGNKPANKYMQDRFGGNSLNAGMGVGNMGRGSQYSSNVNQRPYDYPNQGRQFQESSSSPNSGIWLNAAMGKGANNQQNNQRPFGNMQNKYYNQRGQN